MAITMIYDVSSAGSVSIRLFDVGFRMKLSVREEAEVIDSLTEQVAQHWPFRKTVWLQESAGHVWEKQWTCPCRHVQLWQGLLRQTSPCLKAGLPSSKQCFNNFCGTREGLSTFLGQKAQHCPATFMGKWHNWGGHISVLQRIIP